MPGDPWQDAARTATLELGDEAVIVTTEEVLTEFLAMLSRTEYHRRVASEIVRTIFEDPTTEVVHQSHDSFLSGLELYERRQDKEYSLTDCISMETMRKHGLTEVLTKHFTQEGFTILLGLP